MASLDLIIVSLLATMGFYCDTTSGLIQNLKLVVDGRLGSIPFKHFWKSTGFCPPDPHQTGAGFDLSADMVQNLAYIGAVPHSGIQQVRIHWLLDLVTVPAITYSEPIYEWAYLDQLMDLLYNNGLMPGFELMGSPSGIFTDMENKTQVYWWRSFVRQAALRYINHYGLDWVKQWNFETWNEPDCQDFDEVKMTTQGFLNYYDACSEGLRDANLELRKFGGPGDGCDEVISRSQDVRGSKYAEALFSHVVNGTNYFTGEKGLRMDFISLHRKGGGKSSTILDSEIQSMTAIKERYPELANKPFYNDEADPLVGWSKDETWRATAAYAAMAVKIVCQHQNILIAPGQSFINYTLLSNDNAFLSYYPHQFTQRTLLARFQMNFTSNTQNTTDKGDYLRKNARDYVTFIHKPIYAAMVLLSKLGDLQIPATLFVQGTEHMVLNTSYSGAVATKHVPGSNSTSDTVQWAVIIYSSSDTEVPLMSGKLSFDFTIDSPNVKDLALAIYTVNQLSNPYWWWLTIFNKPDFPTLKMFEVLRKNEGPNLYFLSSVASDVEGKVSIPELTLQEPEVVLLHLCIKSSIPPEQVVGLRMITITAGQVLITWSDTNIKTKCIKTYEVEQSSNESEPFKRINTDDTVVNLFVYATDSEPQVKGFYRVRAVDYWERPGYYSTVIPFAGS